MSTKANGNNIDVYASDSLGALAVLRSSTPSPATCRSPSAFDSNGGLAVDRGRAERVESFTLNWNGTLTRSRPSHGQAATCWVVAVAGYVYASNAGSALAQRLLGRAADRSRCSAKSRPMPGRSTRRRRPTGATSTCRPARPATVDEYAIGAAGALTQIGSVTVPGAVGGEGIVAQ